MNLHILGIRHHGVGSSANLVRRLEEIAPDCILIEGPSEFFGYWIVYRRSLMVK
jgi:hypothetical protein